MNGPAPILEMRSVTKRYGGAAGFADVLRGVDLDVFPGEFVAITGPSGSGKSTLLHLAALLDQPDEGTICLKGQRMSQDNPDQWDEVRKNKIGMVFQRFYLLPHRTVLENVLFRFRYAEFDRQRAVETSLAALKELGLAEISHRKARVLSGGEMQRTAIARAMALQPDLLVADEPTGNLDSVSSATVMEFFRKMNEEKGIAILLVTHNENLLKYCSRHLVCRQGCLEEASL